MTQSRQNHPTSAHMIHCCVLELCFKAWMTPAQRAKQPQRDSLFSDTCVRVSLQPAHIAANSLSISTNLADLALLRLGFGLPFWALLSLVIRLDWQLAWEPRGTFVCPEFLLSGHVALRGGCSDRARDGESGVHWLRAHCRGLPKLGSYANYRHGNKNNNRQVEDRLKKKKKMKGKQICSVSFWCVAHDGKDKQKKENKK